LDVLILLFSISAPQTGFVGIFHSLLENGILTSKGTLNGSDYFGFFGASLDLNKTGEIMSVGSVSDGYGSVRDFLFDSTNNQWISTFSRSGTYKGPLAPTSIVNFKEQNIDIYPNPTSGLIHIQHND